jgi:hypothetical protein
LSRYFYWKNAERMTAYYLTEHTPWYWRRHTRNFVEDNVIDVDCYQSEMHFQNKDDPIMTWMPVDSKSCSQEGMVTDAHFVFGQYSCDGAAFTVPKATDGHTVYPALTVAPFSRLTEVLRGCVVNKPTTVKVYEAHGTVATRMKAIASDHKIMLDKYGGIPVLVYWTKGVRPTVAVYPEKRLYQKLVGEGIV